MNNLTEKLLNILKDENKNKTVIAQTEGYILSIDTILNNGEAPEHVNSFFRIKNSKLYIICAIGNGITFDSLIGNVNMGELDDILNELSAEHINNMEKMFIETF